MKIKTGLAVGIFTVLVSCQTLSAQGLVAAANTSFSIDFYKQHSEKEPGNVFFSPVSISIALSMVYPGARNETAEEIKTVMGFLKKPEKQSAEVSYLIQDVTAAGSPFRVVNTVWVQKGVPFQQEFLTITAEYFKTSLKEANFDDPEGARQEINKTIETQTNNKIKELLPTEAIHSDVLMVLTNAVYFKDSWASPFKKELTSSQNFYPTSGDPIKTMFMQHAGKFPGFENEVVSVLELPYKNADYSLIVLLPKGDMKTFEEQYLTAENYIEWTSSCQSVPFKEIVFPRFKMDHRIDVQKILKDFGMTRSFNASQADFTGIYDGPENLFISDILHKAFIDVNEEGTEAAAATAIGMAIRGAAPTPRDFIANHPFIFVIREKNPTAFYSWANLPCRSPRRNNIFDNHRHERYYQPHYSRQPQNS
ncbi:serpin family protein [Fulvivirgaceae bacterium PWU5]|uniref:Serpin family protein n=1 Tax=Dawidia cretensis TaxID=2782350 RepID=A0AAP2DVL0_9BACT|nr:serpin family protein [Dawidia cretensis]MBT1707214.1 serpin family protein [Dawidia cretensis]